MKKKAGNRNIVSKKLLAALLALSMTVSMTPLPEQIAYADETGTSDEEWQKWESATALPTTEGNYTLSCDVTLAEDYILDSAGKVQLSLGGYAVNPYT